MSSIFSWLKEQRMAISRTWFFNWPSAEHDMCHFPGCGVMRGVHGRAHQFVEHQSKQKEK